MEYMIAVEQRLSAYRIVKALAPKDNVMARLLLAAESFYWSKSVLDAIATQASDMSMDDAERVSQSLGWWQGFLEHPQWWWFEAPVHIGGALAHAAVVNEAGLVVFVGESVLDIHQQSDDAVKYQLLCHLWARDRITIVSEGHIERHRRKQLAREHDAPLPSNVKIVQLRAADYESTTLSDGRCGDRHLTCQFPVREHPRRLSDGRVIQVRAHIKGPKDAPLRIPDHTIYSVSR